MNHLEKGMNNGLKSYTLIHKKEIASCTHKDNFTLNYVLVNVLTAVTKYSTKTT